jgi:hypothetical protein
VANIVLVLDNSGIMAVQVTGLKAGVVNALNGSRIRGQGCAGAPRQVLSSATALARSRLLRTEWKPRYDGWKDHLAVNAMNLTWGSPITRPD